MKFGHDLLVLEAGAPANLRGQFIQYKQVCLPRRLFSGYLGTALSRDMHFSVLHTQEVNVQEVRAVMRCRVAVGWQPCVSGAVAHKHAELLRRAVQLKKLLKQLPAAEDRTEAEQDFFRQLRAEVRAVNQCVLLAPRRAAQLHLLPEPVTLVSTLEHCRLRCSRAVLSLIALCVLELCCLRRRQ